ncbi:MAG: hypothetical protein K6F86_09840 [Lachnospiraceae bacterium]|nr:hypothetical protein [Lachnospiraceae bacterium]
MSKVSSNTIIKIIFTVVTAGALLLNAKSLMGEFQDRVALYRPGFSNQTTYMPQFLEDGRYPDALLRALIRDKEVSVWADFSPYINYPSHGHDHSDDPAIDTFFSNEYYSDNNYGLFFKKYSKTGVVDETLPSPKKVSQAKIGKIRDRQFVFCGNTPDMERYIFLLNEDPEYVNSYFHYSYFYYSCVEEEALRDYFRLYIADEDIENAQSLVAIWDDHENLYVMSRDFYERNMSDYF